ncbi:hypothetical protein Taro_000678, partial [Colocasia esculenta]|nr:hypothetical protein [Colocasia esculenta]
MLDFWKINVQLQGEDRSRICFSLYYIVAARTCSRTSGLVERVPLSIWDLLFDMFTVRDKAAKIAGYKDPMAWMDYSLVWMRRDYWESLCHRWATGPWKERSQEAKRNQAAHLEKNVHTSGSVSYATHSQKLRHKLERAPTFRELFDQTHKQKGTDDYVMESASTIAISQNIIFIQFRD